MNDIELDEFTADRLIGFGCGQGGTTLGLGFGHGNTVPRFDRTKGDGRGNGPGVNAQCDDQGVIA